MTCEVDAKIIAHLSKDDKLKNIIGKVNLAISKKPIKVFDDLLRSIVSQQLSTSAASTIYGRFENSLDNNSPISQQILNKTIEELRSYGLSYQKANYLQNVARHFNDNELHDVDWNKMSDEDIILELTKIKGVGRWTVEMILMFSLFREDVLPLNDLVIRNNMIQIYNVTSEKKQLISDLTNIAASWRPYRSIACRYIWAAKDAIFL